jgi:hypothetical protein
VFAASGGAAPPADGVLLDCSPCRAYLRTYRKTRELTGKASQAAMAEEIKQRLHRFLLDRLSGSEER